MKEQEPSTAKGSEKILRRLRKKIAVVAFASSLVSCGVGVNAQPYETYPDLPNPNSPIYSHDQRYVFEHHDFILISDSRNRIAVFSNNNLPWENENKIQEGVDYIKSVDKCLIISRDEHFLSGADSVIVKDDSCVREGEIKNGIPINH